MSLVQARPGFAHQFMTLDERVDDLEVNMHSFCLQNFFKSEFNVLV